jgi:flavodoxin
MKTLVVYDSLYGNTERIARAIGEAAGAEFTVSSVAEAKPSEWSTWELLFVGAPTHGGRASEPMQDLLKQVPERALEGVKLATFDTRMTQWWARIFGFAAGRIASTLKKKGGTLIGSPEAFYVEGSEGPLREGELERAATWAKQIVQSAM